MKRKEYIDGDAVMDALAEYFGNYAAVPLELEDLIEDIPAESVIECPVLLKEADYQEKIGLFIFGMIVGANLVMILAVLYYGRGDRDGKN